MQLSAKRRWNDGLSEQKRSRLRREAWSTIRFSKHSTWTEKLCGECRKWNRRNQPETWCEHFRAPIPVREGPAVQTFKPYFNPNVCPGGAWLETRKQETNCMKIHGKEWRH